MSKLDEKISNNYLDIENHVLSLFHKDPGIQACVRTHFPAAAGPLTMTI